MNKIFKVKFDASSGLCYAISELGKNCGKTATVAVIGATSVFLSQDANAACPTPAAGGAVVQVGETCEYDGTSFIDGGITNGVIDISGGGTATFTASDIRLQKQSVSGNSPEEYSAIYLREDSTISNNVTFNGNVVVTGSESGNARDIVLGGGSNLIINGDLTVSSKAQRAMYGNSGVIFDLGSGSNTSQRADTSMTIKGNVVGTAQDANFMSVNYGNYVFEKDVTLNAVGERGGSILVGNSATLDFKGHTEITTNHPNEVLDMMYSNEPSTTTVNFNTLTVNHNADAWQSFYLGGGHIYFHNDTTITRNNKDLYDPEIYPYGGSVIYAHGGVISNNGTINVTNQGSIGILANVTEIGTTFNNLENGKLTLGNHIVYNENPGRVNVNNAGLLKSTVNELFKNHLNDRYYEGGIIDVKNSGTLEGYVNSSDEDRIDISNTGIWKNTQNSRLDSLINTGTIEFVAPADNSHINISVDEYTGGGKLIMNTVWDDGTDINGTSTSDVLKIKNLLGSDVTRVQIAKDKIGTITQKNQDIFSLDVIEVENNHTGNLFVGTAATNGAKEAQLQRNGNNYRWALKALDQNSQTQQDIYVKPVTGYVLQPYINSQMGLAQLGQLHQHVGEQYKNGLENKQVWGRLSLNNEDLQGANRFGAKVRSGFVQFGKDVIFKQNADQSHRHIGLTATYGWANASFYDKYNAKNGEITADKYTGKSKTDMFSVGGYHTDYAANGWYIDRVAQISWLRNKYKSEQDARQTGWGFGASVETGKPYSLQRNPNWAIEPQAQLSYQWFKLGSVNDGERYVQGKNQHNLTARLGARLTWNKSEKDNQAQAYFGTHFIQTLIGRTSEVKVGQDRVQENMGGLVVAFDLGGQYPITKNLSLYGDVRYQISLDKHRNSVYRDSHLARESYNGRVGVRYTW